MSGRPCAVSPVWNSSGYPLAPMNAGSRLSIERSISCPGPMRRVAKPMIQFVEVNASSPRGPVCTMPLTNAAPCIISIHPFSSVMVMCIGAAAGSAAVPEACRIKSLTCCGAGLAACICSCCASAGAPARKRINVVSFMVLSQFVVVEGGVG